ncbi:TAXI family TRAP transporter solute-binding subunit [Herbaspirillum lusitanum]|uniref:TAXI family TRAP transporter solute-binding subunit n=1 Tax=Herbaspirillum lusitanum TaxID=213312 RepID=UPI00037F2ABF|nr:TAXI family TRAP transporter solute-binding subunit [Herbaspirillum lusitanum]
MYFIPGMNDGPQLTRQVHLNFGGDWGQANFHRVCSWLCQEVNDRTAEGSRIAIWNTSGGVDSFHHIADKTLDFAISTPAGFAKMALKGIGPFAGKPLSEVRAIGVLPQRDRLVMAIDRKFGVRTYADLRKLAPELKIAGSTNNGRNFIGYATEQMMLASGIAPAHIASWGAELVTKERPEQCIALALAGEVDAVIQEAIMTPWWMDLMKTRDMVLLPYEEEALTTVKEKFGWERAAIEKDYFPGLEQDIAALEFSDFLLLVHADMPEDLANLMTWCLCETRKSIERHYYQFPPDRSPMGYPLDPKKMAATTIPLHPGAEHHYRSIGALS